MLVTKGQNDPRVFDFVTTLGNVDFVDADGAIHTEEPVRGVMVRSEDDLALSAFEDYSPGTIAFTAGFENLWQKAADGTWASI